MKVNRLEIAGILSAIALVVLAGVFALSQPAYADDVDPCALPGMGALGCDDNHGETVVPVDPCDITPCNDENSLGEQITCEVYEELVAQGEPIPADFDASGCDDDGNGGGGAPACNDGTDNDNDGTVDSNDPGCSGPEDTDETDPSGGGGGGGGGGSPACSDGSDNDGDGKIDRDDPGCEGPTDTDETNPSGGGGGGGGGGSGGGSVLGTTTPAVCDRYLTEFIKFGGNNNPEQVQRLQHVLKAYEGADVEESGVFDEATLSAVHAFQTKYWDTILAPWNIKQSTGFVYLTTRKKVNEIYCKNEVMFPLSPEENALIESTKVPGAAVAAAAATSAAKPAEKPAPTDTKKAEKKVEKPADEGATKRSGWGAVGDFFRRLFNRGR